MQVWQQLLALLAVVQRRQANQQVNVDKLLTLCQELPGESQSNKGNEGKAAATGIGTDEDAKPR